MGKRYLINATRLCASIVSAEIIWSGIICHCLEEDLNNYNSMVPEQHIEDSFISDRNGLNQENNITSVSGTGTVLTFTVSKKSSTIIF